MGFSGELIVQHYSANVYSVRDSLLWLKYNTVFGDILLRTHKNGVNVAFALVFIHMYKGLSTWAGAGARMPIWKSGVGILICMYGASYAGCILPWNVLSPTLYTMAQTILDVYAGGWTILILLGGDRMINLVLERTLVVHILICLFGLGFLLAHIRFIHFSGSSVNKHHTWARVNRPLWLPNELVKEVFLMFFFFYLFIYALYRKPMSFGSIYITVYKFYYGGATNWNPLPASIEPEWYFWIFYFALASAESLSGGLFRAIFLFFCITFVYTFKDLGSTNWVFTFDSEMWNGFFYFFFAILCLIFFTRAKFKPWHTGILDSMLISFVLTEVTVYPVNMPLIAAYCKKHYRK